MSIYAHQGADLTNGWGYMAPLLESSLPSLASKATRGIGTNPTRNYWITQKTWAIHTKLHTHADNGSC